MSDPFNPPELGEEPEQPESGPYPWDAEPPADDPDAPRQRHDAFTEARKSEYLKALVKTGGIQDACRKTGVSPRTVYRHQQDDPAFFENCRIALSMSGTPVELTAWSRAVEGVEEEFVVRGEVRVRRRYDAGLLRLLLQGSNPKKYGPRPGFKRKRVLKHERKQMEREIRAEIAAEQRPYSFEESIELLERQINALEQREAPKKFAAGWTKSPDGHWIPPGYGPIPGWQAPNGDGPDDGGHDGYGSDDGAAGDDDGSGTPCVSM